MGYRGLVGRVRARAAAPYPIAPIPKPNVFESTPSGRPDFAQGDCYLEVRLAQLHLRHQRDWWREFLPLASVVTDVQFRGARTSIAYLSGPATLKDQLDGVSGQVDIYNKRVAGPIPYAGDDVGLFVGLCRTKTVDWAQRTFEVLEDVAKALDVTRISSFVTVSGPLMQGLESLLGMDKTELRIAVDQDLVLGGDHSLVPGWQAMFAPDARLDGASLGVLGDRLHVWRPDRNEWAPYLASDFVLVHLRSLDSRDDYEGFEFHRVYWPRVQDRVWDYQFDAAHKAFEALMSSLMQCTDLTRRQRGNLFASYRTWFEQDLANARSVHDGVARLDSTISRRVVEPAQLTAAATTTAGAMSRDVEALLDAFDR